jgi:hypothetical protein
VIKANSQVLLHIIISLFFSLNKSEGRIIKQFLLWLSTSTNSTLLLLRPSLAWIIPILSIYLHNFITIVNIITAVLHPQMCNHHYSWHQKKYTELYTNSTPPKTSLNNNHKDHHHKNEEPCHNPLTPQCLTPNHLWQPASSTTVWELIVQRIERIDNINNLN